MSREFTINNQVVSRTFTVINEDESRTFTVTTGIGSSGASAYTIAVNNGFVGTEAEWLASLQGSDADVTNANVNAAIEDDPEATRESLGLGTAALQDTADFAPALGADDNYVTDAQLAVIENTSGTNTGDQDLSGYALTTDLADYLPLAGGTMDDNAIITFDNGSRLKEGTTNAGANGGIAQVCSIDYELKWEAGRLFVMQQDGFTIRVEQYGFTVAPTATDDETKGYIVGSRRILDDGSAFTCTDSTEDAAVWRREYSGNTSVTTWHYRAKTTITTGNPTDGHVIWNDATQINATSINVSHKDQDGDDIEFFLGFIQEGQQLFLQDRDVSQNFQIWLVSGTPTLTGGGTANAYFTFPVTLVDSGGTGTTGFANNHQLLFGTTQSLALHAPTHAEGGSDPITPADIGALSLVGGTMTGDIIATNIIHSGGVGLTFGATDVALINGDLSLSSYDLVSVSEIKDQSLLNSIDATSRQLFADDGSTVMLDWSNHYSFTVGTDIFVSSPFSVVCGDAAYVYMSPNGIGNTTSLAINVPNYQLIATDGTTVMLDWSDTIGEMVLYGYPHVAGLKDGYGMNAIEMDLRQLIGTDGSTVMAQWSNLNYLEAYQIYGIGGSAGIDFYNAKLMDASFDTLDWVNRTFNDAAGNPIAKWGEDNSTGNYGIAFGPDGMGTFYHLLNADGLNFLYSSRYGGNTIDYNGVTAIDVQNSQLIGTDGTTVALDWSDGTGIQVNAIIRDSSNLDSISPTSRLLVGSDGSAIALDWSTGIPDFPNGFTSLGSAGTYGQFDEIANQDFSAPPAFTYGATLTPMAVVSLVGGEGTIAYVNDALVPVIASAVADGGSAKCLVCYNGTSWIVTALL